MRILVIAPQPFFEPRGTPISVFQRMHGLSKLGYDVDLLTIHVGADVEIPDVTIHRTVSIPFIKKVSIGPSAAKLFLDVLLFFKAFMMLVRKRYDVIHSHEEAAFFSMVLGFIFRVPHVYDMHSSLPQQLENFDSGRSKYNKRLFVRLFQFLERMVLKSCAVVLTVGVDLEEYVKEIVPQANEIRVENTAIHNLVQPDQASVEQLRERLALGDRPVVVYTGNLEPYQGIDLLFASMQLLIGAYPELSLLIVGGTELMIEKYRQRAGEMGLSDNVVFVGTVPVTEALEYLELATLLASPRTEGLSVPLKLYSYLYSGKPVVATNIYAHTQSLTDERAMLVETAPSDFADGMRRLLDDGALCRALGENGRAYVEEAFSMGAYLTKLEHAFLSATLSRSVDEVATAMGEAHAQPPALSGN